MRNSDQYSWQEHPRVTEDMRPNLLIRYSWRKRLGISLLYASIFFAFFLISRLRGTDTRSLTYYIIASISAGIFISFVISYFNYVLPVRFTINHDYLILTIGDKLHPWQYGSLVGYKISSRWVQRDEYSILTLYAKDGSEITMGMDNSSNIPKIESLLQQRGLNKIPEDA